VPEASGDPAPGGWLLPAVARRSLEEAFACASLRRGWSAVATADWLRRPAATFVTLRMGETLRGCVGSVEASRAVAEDVWENARAAAFRDLRFQPLAAAELTGIAIEVSLLSPLKPLGASTPEEARRLLRPEIDGVVFRFGSYRGLFLPQVWEELPTGERFLAELARKAGLPAGFWAPGVELWRFTVQKWVEAGDRSTS
jgi:AmmeMemoRadiSam system protein A